jgi:hypothetical protein
MTTIDRSQSVLDVCLALHTSATGASDPLPDDELKRMTAWLRVRVDGWRKTHARSERFDDAVFLLARAALEDAERDREWRMPAVATMPERPPPTTIPSDGVPRQDRARK